MILWYSWCPFSSCYPHNWLSIRSLFLCWWCISQQSGWQRAFFSRRYRTRIKSKGWADDLVTTISVPLCGPAANESLLSAFSFFCFIKPHFKQSLIHISCFSRIERWWPACVDGNDVNSSEVKTGIAEKREYMKRGASIRTALWWTVLFLGQALFRERVFGEDRLKQFLRDDEVEYPLDCFDLIQKIKINRKIGLDVETTDRLYRSFETTRSSFFLALASYLYPIFLRLRCVHAGRTEPYI